MRLLKVRIGIILILILITFNGCSMKTAGGYYKDGLKSFQSGDYDVAALNFKKALELNTERAEYYIDYAMTLMMLNQYEEALTNFDHAILENKNSIVYMNNKKAYRGKGIAYFKMQNYKEAINQFDLALSINELSDMNVDILYYKGKAQENASLYTEAVQTYSAILVENPGDAAIYYNRAYAFYKLGDYNNSLNNYNKAISLDDKNYDYYLGKYLLLLGNGEEDDASSILEKAATIEAVTQEDKFSLAKIHYYMGNYDASLSEFNEASKNGFPEAYLYLGNIYKSLGDFDSAEYNYRMFIENENTKKSAAVYNEIAICLMELEDFIEALEYIESGLEYQDIEYDQTLKHNEIVIYEYLGDYNKAYHLMSDYLKTYPGEEEAAREFDFIKTRLPEISNISE